jgi:DNA-binding PadR family transcriptional regulator
MMTVEKEEKTTANWMKEAQKGYIRMGVLILLNKKPSHGYEIMKEIDNRTKGFWTPTPGGVYPVLRDLEKSGYIRGEWQTQKNRRLKVYWITNSGQTILKKAIVKQSEISKNIANLFREFSREVLQVEPEAVIPDVPSMFSPFLEEDYEKEYTLKQLEHQRRHMRETIITVQEKVRLIDKKISTLRKKSKIAQKE